VDELPAWIYPNRIAIAIATVLLVGLVAVVGWRRGWQQVAVRHPRATGALVVAALAVGLPASWYLGSPLIIRSELVEPPPVAEAAQVSPDLSPGPSAQVPSASPSSSHPKQQTTPAPTQSRPLTSLRGRFRGADDFHYARGTARLVETAAGRFTVRLEDFSVRNGPDLFVYLSPNPDGYAKGSIELGRLKATDGSFNYAVPAGVDVARIRSVVIWCKAFSVQFGAAELRA
jgi:hypothetical protein